MRGGGVSAHRSQSEDFNVKSVVERAQPKRVSRVAFGMFSGSDVTRLASLNVTAKELYSPNRTPAPNGALDARLGTSNNSTNCGTCGMGLQDCAGHHGFIRLELPVFHIGFFKATLAVLQCVCKTCSRVLLPPADRRRHMAYMMDPGIDSVRKSRNFKAITDETSKVRECPWCKATNGVIRKVTGAPALRISHNKYPNTGPSKEEGLTYREQFAHLKDNKDLSKVVDSTKLKESVTPLDALRILSAVPEEDLPLLWISAGSSRPESLILTHILVPPVCIRPSVAMDAGAFNEDDLTVNLQKIIVMNDALRVNLERGATLRNVMEAWDYMHVLVGSYLNGDLPGFPAPVKEKKPSRGLCQRLKGKQGRFRQNLLGKRVDFSGRTVISPDPNLGLHEVGVPRRIACILTYPEVVTDLNRARLQQAVRNGPRYPGAHTVRFTNGNVKNLEYANRDNTAKTLRTGDVVDRHMIDGDVVLFNRQPSLHKMSIMSHRARVMDWRTFRFNECVCPPYNADFDGDEMNLHLPQTEEARAEAAQLMDVRENLVTPRSGQPLVAANQDFFTASYLLTQRNVFLDREAFCSAVAYLNNAMDAVDIPEPAILKPVQLWTGKQVMTMLLCPNSGPSAVRVNLECKERNFAENSEANKAGLPIMCPDEGYVIFRNGEHLVGNLGKSTLGSNKKGLVYDLIRNHDSYTAARCLHRLTRMTTRWLTNYGFSIGIEDVIPSPELSAAKQSLVQQGYDDCDQKIEEFKAGSLQRLAGCSELETLESQMNGILGRLRNKAGDMCKRELPPHNAPLVMENCGSKGSALNICQMIACVGQQAVGGNRIPEGFINRTLPLFPPNAKDPPAKGFVVNSFFTGLEAHEFFFHTMGGREGLVDTAVKTAQTGYMQRRMVKAMEDFSIQYDTTVRGSADTVVQFAYGDDGLDPSFMEPNGRPVDFVRLVRAVKSEQPVKSSVDRILTPSEIVEGGEVLRTAKNWMATPKSFRDEAAECCQALASAVQDAMEVWGLPLMRAVTFDKTSEEYNAWATEFLSGGGGGGAGAASGSPSSPSPSSLPTDFVDTAVTAIANTCGVTVSQLETVHARALAKFNRARIAPGEAVGVASAHSLGEPATQMTLKTFHFAGVASMNVTLGVPRITEIINANTSIATPLIQAPLQNPYSEQAGRVAQAAIEETTLGDVAKHIRELHGPTTSCLEILLDEEGINGLFLNITAQTVKRAIFQAARPRLAMENMAAVGNKVYVSSPRQGFRAKNFSVKRAGGGGGGAGAGAGAGGGAGAGAGDDDDSSSGAGMDGEEYFSIQALKAMLPGVVVSGIPGVLRAVITQVEDSERPPPKSPKDADKPYYQLLVEGGSYTKILGAEGIEPAQCKSNHVIDVETTLGIEAARASIMTEIMETYKNYGIDLDLRHLSVLADTMTCSGKVLGITRFGLEKMKESVLANASFEKTPDHLFDAAVHSRVDRIEGVSACIIMGVPMGLGTGAFRLLYKGTADSAPLPKRRSLLLS